MWNLFSKMRMIMMMMMASEGKIIFLDSLLYGFQEFLHTWLTGNSSLNVLDIVPEIIWWNDFAMFSLYFSYWRECLISYEKRIPIWWPGRRRNLSWDPHKCWKSEPGRLHLQTSQTFVDCEWSDSIMFIEHPSMIDLWYTCTFHFCFD